MVLEARVNFSSSSTVPSKIFSDPRSGVVALTDFSWEMGGKWENGVGENGVGVQKTTKRMLQVTAGRLCYQGNTGVSIAGFPCASIGQAPEPG